MTPTHKLMIQLFRTAARAEIYRWHNPTDEEMQRLFDERISKAIEALEENLGDETDEHKTHTTTETDRTA